MLKVGDIDGRGVMHGGMMHRCGEATRGAGPPAATAGRSVSITMTATGTVFDTYLYLYDGVSCGEVASDDDGAATNQDSLVLFTPSTTGTYYLIATTYAEGARGTYTLTTN